MIEEMSRMGFGGVATGYGIHSNIVAPYINHFGTDQQKQHWLPKMITGEAVGALAMTEPGAGSDVQAIRVGPEGQVEVASDPRRGGVGGVEGRGLTKPTTPPK